MNDILAMDSIGRIVGSLGKFVKTKVIDEEILKNLQYGATLGGLALSNVRTGLLHDAGESLSSQISISHPETMVIFFNESLILYGKAIKEHLEILSQTMERYYENNGFDRVVYIMIFWDKLFEEFSIKEDIGNRLKDIFIDRNLISEKIMKDSVLVNKESPIILTRDIVDKFIVKSLDF
jgi:alcohol dehydrogenase class IV